MAGDEPNPAPSEHMTRLVREAASLLAELYDPAGALIYWSSRIRYLDHRRPCDVYREGDEAAMETLVRWLNMTADGAWG